MINVQYDGVRYSNFSSNELRKKGVPENVIQSAAQQSEWAVVRDNRDALLRASDYAVMPDYPLTDAQKTEVTAYRQALRDIPETAADPDAVEWPEKPEALT